MNQEKLDALKAVIDAEFDGKTPMNMGILFSKRAVKNIVPNSAVLRKYLGVSIAKTNLTVLKFLDKTLYGEGGGGTPDPEDPK